MMRSFGQFKARVREQNDTPPEDRPVIKAYHQGESAGRADAGLAECPYAPFSDEARWRAWMIGYEEVYERYAIVDGTATAAANGDLPVLQDCQARAEGIAHTQSAIK